MQKLMKYCNNYFMKEKVYSNNIVINQSKISVKFKNNVTINDYIGIVHDDVIEVSKVVLFDDNSITLDNNIFDGIYQGYIVLLKVPKSFVELYSKITKLEDDTPLPKYQSESVPNYSYNLSDEYKSKGAYGIYKNEISLFKKLPKSLGKMVVEVTDYGIN